MDNETYAALDTSLAEHSDDYLTGYAAGVADTVASHADDVTESLAELHLSADLMRWYRAERARRAANTSKP